MRKNSMAKLHEVIRGDQNKDLLSSNYIYRRCVLAALRTIKLGLTMVGNQAKPLKYSKKKNCISYQFRADVQTCGHRPRYTADNDAAQTDVCTPKCQFAA